MPRGRVQCLSLTAVNLVVSKALILSNKSISNGCSRIQIQYFLFHLKTFMEELDWGEVSATVKLSQYDFARFSPLTWSILVASFSSREKWVLRYLDSCVSCDCNDIPFFFFLIQGISHWRFLSVPSYPPVPKPKSAPGISMRSCSKPRHSARVTGIFLPVNLVFLPVNLVLLWAGSAGVHF